MTPLSFLESQSKMESKNKIGFLLSSNTLKFYILKRLIQVAAEKLRLDYKLRA